MYDFIEDNKKSLIVLGILILITILFLIINGCTKKKHEYIYTVKSSKEFQLPYIDIKSDEINELNNLFEKEYNEFVKNSNYKSYYKYEYSISGDILSILIKKAVRPTKDSFLEEEYDTYNISISTKKFLSDKNIIEKFNLNSEDIEEKIEDSLDKQYNYEVKRGYLEPREYGLDDFLSDKNYNSIDDNLRYYIKNSKVYGYLNIKNASMYYDINNYPKTKKVYLLN